MSKRRELLKALSIAGGAAAVETWKKPLVNAVNLPAHAQTSCNVIADCYNTPGGEGSDQLSIQWPGGTGPSSPGLFTGSDCTGSSAGALTVVVASSLSAAETACGTVASEIPSPDLPAGCSFWTCE